MYHTNMAEYEESPVPYPAQSSPSELVVKLQNYNRDNIEKGMLKTDAVAMAMATVVDEEVTLRTAHYESIMRSIGVVMEPFVQTLLQLSQTVEHVSEQLDAIADITTDQIMEPYKNLLLEDPTFASYVPHDGEPLPPTIAKPGSGTSYLTELLSNIDRLRDDPESGR